MDMRRRLLCRASSAPGQGRRLIAFALVGLLLSGCAAPTVSPTPLATSPSPPPSEQPLAVMLSDAVDPGAILADLDHLGAIADAHDGVRVAGGDGHAAAATWVADELRRAGYQVTLDSLLLPLFSQDAPGVLEIAGTAAPILRGSRDFKAMLLSPPGEVIASVFALDFDREARPGDRNGTACETAGWANVPEGAIVLVQPGPCWTRTIVDQAQAAGAAALIVAYPGWGPGEVRRPTLLDPAGLDIPVIAATGEAGLALADAAASGDRVHLRISTTTSMLSSESVIGETPGGDPDHVLMIGGHLDSVIDGPGVNDNGSGTMTILEIARRLAALTGGEPTWKVRVAFWTGEEIGLWGSVHYVDGLGDSGLSSIAAYLNFDMLGSPNGVRQVYAADPGNTAAATLERLFTEAFKSEGLTSETVDLNASSDGYRFDQAGVPVGGLFSGANEPKSEAQAIDQGGSAGTPYDACYHLACDTIDNVDADLLGQMAHAAARVVGALAGGEVELAR